MPFYKILSPIRKEGKLYMPGETVELEDNLYKYIKQCVEPIITPTVQATKKNKSAKLDPNKKEENPEKEINEIPEQDDTLFESDEKITNPIINEEIK